MSGDTTMVPGASRGSSYALQQLLRAFNTNATSWIGLVTFLAAAGCGATENGAQGVQGVPGTPGAPVPTAGSSARG
jgi:hypothetical protein